jgi:hypothetical protein
MVTTQQVLAHVSGFPRDLTWADFRRVPQSMMPPYYAHVATRLTATHADAQLDPDGSYRWKRIQVNAIIDAASTWVVDSWLQHAPAAQMAYLLQHEQGHLDICGLIARDLCRELLETEVSDAVISVLQGVANTPQARLQAAINELHADAQRHYRDAETLYGRLESQTINGTLRDGQYERETRHGRNAAAQRRWTTLLNYSRTRDEPLSLTLLMFRIPWPQRTTSAGAAPSRP